MSFDTTEINKARQNLHDYDEIWLFGYGSLIYKVDFPYIQKQIASISGWERRFWQGSHDHRGTPEQPGRVVTLVESTGAVCTGMAFQVTHDVLEHLDHREKNGYLRHEVAIQLHSGDIKTGLIYIADEHNSAYLGEDTELNIAKQVYSSVGPSGKNTDYVLQLAESIRGLNAEDEHVFAIEGHLRNML
jgi:cation transport regulator ChaC